MMCFHAIILYFVLVSTGDASRWTWKCESKSDESICVKHLATVGSDFMSLDRCKLTCSKGGVVWPKPTFITLSHDVTTFLPANINYKFDCQGMVCFFLRKAVQHFESNMAAYHPDYNPKYNRDWDEANWAVPFESPECIRNLSINLLIRVKSKETVVTLNTNESYSLNITNDPKHLLTIIIEAPTFFGARHALETLTQLMAYNDEQNGLYIVTRVSIKDSPTYKYRGILLDTARNFFPVEDIKRSIDGMAANKLNTFHWHIADASSFPVYLTSLPQMTEFGAYSPKKVYRPEDVRTIVEHGRMRGVRVVPEFDAPGHVNNGFQWGELQGLGKLTACSDAQPWQSYCASPPCGQLNLANENIYEVLKKIYTDFVDMFSPIDLFHFGGDEVNLKCWNTTEEITKWMTKRGNDLSADSYYKEWSVFQNKAEKLFTAANKKEVPGIVWTSKLTNKNHVDKYLDPAKYIIQIWTTGKDEVIKGLLEKKFRLIFSNSDAWYFDCGLGAWVGEGNNWCSPYKGWQKVYDNSPREMAGEAHMDKVLGGEAALWSEQVDSTSLDSRLWPRGAALAERLWSDPNHNWESAERRFIHHRQRMVQRGFKADRIQPEWCHQNEHLCTTKATTNNF